MAAPLIIGTLAAAVIVFAMTNVDDIVLLSIFFADPKIRPRTVVAGQFIGMGVLVLVSAAAGAAAVAIPPRWTSLLGIIPLLLGVYKLVTLVRSRAMVEEPDTLGSRSNLAAVIGVTVANGGDNLSVYIPLFAADRGAIVLYVIVFAGMTALWCALGYKLVHNRVFGARLQRYGHVLLPFVLVGLGIYILSHSALRNLR